MYLSFVHGVVRDGGEVRAERHGAAFAQFGGVRGVDVRVGLLYPIEDVRLGHGGDGSGRPVGEVEMVLEPQRRRPGKPVRAMTGALDPSDVECVVSAGAEVVEEVGGHAGDGDDIIGCAVDHQGGAVCGVQIVERLAAVAEE
jgi:hypothetical protein